MQRSDTPPNPIPWLSRFLLNRLLATESVAELVQYRPREVCERPQLASPDHNATFPLLPRPDRLTVSATHPTHRLGDQNLADSLRTSAAGGEDLGQAAPHLQLVS